MADATLFGLVRDIKQRRQDARIRDQLKNYLTDPESTIKAVNEISPETAIGLQRQRQTDLAAGDAATREAAKQQAGNFAQVTSYLRGLPQGADYGKALDDLTPFLQTNLGMRPEQVASARAAIVAQPSVIAALDDEARKEAGKYYVAGPGSALIKDGQVVHSQPFAPRASGSPGSSGASQPRSGASFRTLPPEEAAPLGFTEGTVAQVNEKTGKITVLAKPAPAKGGAGKYDPIAVRSRANDALEGLSRLEEAASAILNDESIDRSVGVVSGRVPSVVLGQGVQDFRNKTEALRSNVGLQALQMFKAMSAVGASGFGNLSNEEGRRLERMLGTLDNTSSPALLKKTLSDIVAFSQKHKASLEAGLNPPAAPTAPAIGTIARNPKTGAKVQFNGRGWVPVK